MRFVKSFSVARSIAFVVLMLAAPLLAACGDAPPSEMQYHDQRTELRREQDCANPKWKAANLGLWYNICPSGADTLD